MVDDNDTDGIKQILRNLNEPIEKFFLIIDAIGWVILTLIFLGATIVAFSVPEPFKPLSEGIGLLGITLSSLALFLYVTDKLRNRIIEQKIDERLKRIEVMVKKWDFE